MSLSRVSAPKTPTLTLIFTFNPFSCIALDRNSVIRGVQARTVLPKIVHKLYLSYSISSKSELQMLLSIHLRNAKPRPPVKILTISNLYEIIFCFHAPTSVYAKLPTRSLYHFGYTRLLLVFPVVPDEHGHVTIFTHWTANNPKG